MDRTKIILIILQEECHMTNILTQRKNESLEAYVARIKSMSDEAIQEAAEQQRAQVLDNYLKNTKQSSYKRKVYHK